MNGTRALSRLPPYIRIPIGLSVLGVLLTFQIQAYSGKRALDQLREEEHAAAHRETAPEPAERVVGERRVLSRGGAGAVPPQQGMGTLNRLVLASALVGSAGLTLLAAGWVVMSFRRPEQDEVDPAP